MPLVLSGGARFAGGIQGRAPAAVVAAPAANDPYFMYNSLLLLGNGTNNSQNNTFLDGSTNNFSITRNGNTTQGTFSPYGANWSNYFDGTGDYLTAPSDTAYQFGTGDFTIEYWIYQTASGSYRTVLDTRASGTASPWACLINSSNQPYILITSDLTSSIAITINAWNHVAIVRSGTNLSIYVNGVSGLSTTNSTNISPTGSLRVGFTVDTVYPMIGHLSNIRIVKGTAVYTGNFTPSTTPLTAIANTSLLTCQSNRFIDNSTNAFAITRNGDTSIQRFSPFSPGAAYSASTIGGSAYFDGSGDYLTAGSNSAFAVGTGDFTFQVCVYPTAYTSPVGAIFDTGSSVASGRFSVVLYANGILRVDSNANLLSSSSALPLNQWTFISIIRSSGTMTMYFNGTSVASASVTNNFTETQGLIGKTVDNYYFQGYISNLRLVKGTALANTVPTAPLTAVANTQLLLSNTNAGIIDNAMINNLETLGNAKISTTQSKFGGSSMYFDGNGDFLYVPASSNGVLGNTWTIECWYQATSRSNTYPVIISVTDGNSNYANTIALFDRHNSASSNFSFAVGSGTLTVGTTTVSNGTWYHLALVSNGGVVTLYVNGVSEVSASRTTGSVNKAFYVGANFDYASYPTYLNGYIDDLRVTKGYARYTANFTPPTAELPGQ